MTTKRQTFFPSFPHTNNRDTQNMGKQQRRQHARENEEGEKSIFANSSALAKGPPRYSSVVFVLLRVVHASRFERRENL